jgi:hypothetical protein
MSDYEDYEDPNIGQYMHGTYDPDMPKEEDEDEKEENDIYEQMNREFNLTNINIRGEKIFKSREDPLDLIVPDDILMQINLNENIEKDNKDIEDLIDRGLETRFFQNDPNSFLNSRVGLMERTTQTQNLGTILKGFDKMASRQEKINRMYMNAQELFSINFYKACNKYGIDKKEVDGLMDLIFQSEYFEYKNPFGILFGYLSLKGKNINIQKMIDVHKKYAIHENITLLDLTRYARFILSLY